MSLTKQDREWIELTVRTTVEQAIKPTAELAHDHEVALHGKTGNNGLRSQVRYLNRFAWLLTGGILLAGTVIGSLQLHIF